MVRSRLVLMAALVSAALLLAMASRVTAGGGGGWGGGHGGGYGGGGFHEGGDFRGYGFRGYGYGYGRFGYGYGYGYGGFGFLDVGLDYPPPIYVVNPAPVVVTGAPAMPPPPSLYSASPTENRAQIRVRLPADAILWFDGVPTTQTGPEREFTTPPLNPGNTFFYNIKARWMQSGQPVERTLQIPVRANETSSADFNALPAPRG